MDTSHRIDLSKVVRRGKHVTNRVVTVEGKIDIDGDVFTAVPIPFCEVDKVDPIEDDQETFYVNNLKSLIDAGFEEIKITKLKG